MEIIETQWRIQDFPSGGGAPTSDTENERIRSRWGTGIGPPGSANETNMCGIAWPAGKSGRSKTSKFASFFKIFGKNTLWHALEHTVFEVCHNISTSSLGMMMLCSCSMQWHHCMYRSYDCLNKRLACMCQLVLSPKTFDGLRSQSTCRYRCIWCILATGTYFLQL